MKTPIRFVSNGCARETRCYIASRRSLDSAASLGMTEKRRTLSGEAIAIPLSPVRHVNSFLFSPIRNYFLLYHHS